MNPQTQPHIDLATHNDRSRWDDYVLDHPDGLAYQLFAWKEALEVSYGFNCPYVLAETDGHIQGILPMVHVRLPFCSGSLVSLPYCDAGGILADSDFIADALLNYAFEYAADHRISEIELRFHNPYPPSVLPDMPTETPASFSKVRMRLPLPSSSKALMASFKSKLRSQVRKPGRDGLRATVGGIELLDDFYTLFAEHMRDLGSPVHSRNWLRGVLERYGEKARCAIIKLPDGTPGAGGIILCHSKTVSIPWASSLLRCNHWNPNMLLYWTFLQYAAENGYTEFDFGRSTPGEGTYRFKQQWGAEPHPLYWVRWRVEKDGVRHVYPASNSNGKSRKMAEKLIQKMPIPIMTILGSGIRKYISL